MSSITPITPTSARALSDSALLKTYRTTILHSQNSIGTYNLAQKSGMLISAKLWKSVTESRFQELDILENELLRRTFGPNWDADL